MSVDARDGLEMYRTMILIRSVEETLVRLFSQDLLPGFIHSYIGEEATAVGVCAALRPDDYLTSTHRGHGHILAKGGDLDRFFAELYGKATGLCRGKGGSMHVADFDLGILGANGVVGGGIPIAAGAALSAKMQGFDRVAVAFLGDGATDIGVFHESLNLASLWDVPVIFVCENNGYAEFVPVHEHQKIGRVADRAGAYAIPGLTVDGNDVRAVNEATTQAVDRARRGGGPTLIECVTFRWRGHFEGDPQPYRPEGETDEWRRSDPIARAAGWLRDEGILDERLEAEIAADVGQRIQAAIAFAESSPMPAPEDALSDVYTDLIAEGWDA